MKSSLLLPNKFKLLGWILFIPSFLTGLNILITGYEFPFLQTNVFTIFPEIQAVEPSTIWIINTNITFTIVGLVFIISSLFIAFSKEKNEDEFIASIRLKSLLWAVLVNYLLLILAFLVIYELNFLSVMTYNMFTVLLLFIFRFHYLLFRSKAALTNEK